MNKLRLELVIYDTSFIFSLNLVFPFSSHVLAVMLPISYGFSFFPFYATTPLESFGVTVLVSPDLMKVASHVAAVSPIQKFESLNIFASSEKFISFFP